MSGLVHDFVTSPAFGLIVAAVIAEVRSQVRARQARRERDDFRAELAAMVQADHDSEG